MTFDELMENALSLLDDEQKEAYYRYCDFYAKENPTNADRIRAMMDEELAEYLFKHDFCKTPFQSDGQNLCDGDCEKCLHGWLNSPVEVDDG